MKRVEMGAPPIRWRAAMSVDGGVIDADHQYLIEIINSFGGHRHGGRPLAREIDTLNALKFYAETHFAREEHLHHLVGYPEGLQHRDEHRELSITLDAIIRRAAAPLDEGDAARITGDVGVLLKRWLLSHTLTTDLRMKRYAAAMSRHAFDLPPLRTLRRAR